MDVLARHLRHVAQQLQHNVGNQCTRHVRRFSVPCARVEQRHIQHHDGRPALFCNKAPFLEYLAVVTAQTIDGQHHQHVPIPQHAQQIAISRTVEVLAARTVSINIRRLHAIGDQRIKLPIQVLITRAHARIAVHSRHLIPAFL